MNTKFIVDGSEVTGTSNDARNVTCEVSGTIKTVQQEITDLEGKSGAVPEDGQIYYEGNTVPDGYVLVSGATKSPAQMSSAIDTINDNLTQTAWRDSTATTLEALIDGFVNSSLNTLQLGQTKFIRVDNRNDLWFDVTITKDIGGDNYTGIALSIADATVRYTFRKPVSGGASTVISPFSKMEMIAFFHESLMDGVVHNVTLKAESTYAVICYPYSRRDSSYPAGTSPTISGNYTLEDRSALTTNGWFYLYCNVQIIKKNKGDDNVIVTFPRSTEKNGGFGFVIEF